MIARAAFLTLAVVLIVPFGAGAAVEPCPAGDALCARVAENPDDLAARAELARALERDGRMAEAADAWRAILDRDPDNTRAHAKLGEVLVAAERGRVSDAALEALLTGMTDDSFRPRGLFYAGIGFSQRGHLETAARLWRALLEQGGEEARFRPMVERYLAEAAKALGREPDSFSATVPPVAELRARLDG